MTTEQRGPSIKEVQQWPIPGHPGWFLQGHEMVYAEVFVPTANLVLVSERRIQDLEACLAHAAAHLDLGHHMRGTISDEDEAWARQLAELRC